MKLIFVIIIWISGYNAGVVLRNFKSRRNLMEELESEAAREKRGEGVTVSSEKNIPMNLTNLAGTVSNLGHLIDVKIQTEILSSSDLESNSISKFSNPEEFVAEASDGTDFNTNNGLKIVRKTIISLPEAPEALNTVIDTTQSPKDNIHSSSNTSNPKHFDDGMKDRSKVINLTNTNDNLSLIVEVKESSASSSDESVTMNIITTENPSLIVTTPISEKEELENKKNFETPKHFNINITLEQHSDLEASPTLPEHVNENSLIERTIEDELNLSVDIDEFGVNNSFSDFQNNSNMEHIHSIGSETSDNNIHGLNYFPSNISSEHIYTGNLSESVVVFMDNLENETTVQTENNLILTDQEMDQTTKKHKSIEFGLNLKVLNSSVETDIKEKVRFDLNPANSDIKISPTVNNNQLLKSHNIDEHSNEVTIIDESINRTKINTLEVNQESENLITPSSGFDFFVNSEVAKNAMEVFNISDSSLADHVIEDSDFHSLIDLMLPSLTDEIEQQNNKIPPKTIEKFHETAVSKSSVQSLTGAEPKHINKSFNTGDKNKSVVEYVDLTIIDAKSTPFVTATLNLVEEDRKCPPPGLCVFWFASQDTCSHHSQCLKAKLCCKIRCSKHCIDV